MCKQFLRRLVWLCYPLLTIYTAHISAANLLEVFRDALTNDPTFKQAEAQWGANKQQLPLALAALLPQIDATANLTENHTHQNINGRVISSGDVSVNTYAISLQQPVFNLSLWAQLSGANASVKSATALYTAAFQDLIVRTTQAYLTVLQAYDALRYTLEDKRATYQQLVSQQQRFKVGLVAITDVYDAQSQFDAIVAQEIVARNQLDTALEQLQAITGHYYLCLSGLTTKGIPMNPPAPKDINAWVQIARRQDYSLIAQQYATKVAYENILSTAANHLPTVTLQSGYQKSVTDDSSTPLQGSSHITQETSAVGLAINLPIYSGGAIVAATQQARYLYAQAAATLEFTHRQVVSLTRQAYLGIVSAISQVQADIQAIQSAKNAVISTEEGYRVGTRTIVDLLNAFTRQYQTEQQLAVDQYSYTNNFVVLKQQAGTLGINDIRIIDTWLARPIQFSGEYAPTRLRMENGTFSYQYKHYEIPEEKQGLQLSTTTSTNLPPNTEEAITRTTPAITTTIPTTTPALPSNNPTSTSGTSNGNMPAEGNQPNLPVNGNGSNSSFSPLNNQSIQPVDNGSTTPPTQGVSPSNAISPPNNTTPLPDLQYKQPIAPEPNTNNNSQSSNTSSTSSSSNIPPPTSSLTLPSPQNTLLHHRYAT